MRTFDPSPLKSGPGSAFARIGRRRLRKKQQQQQQQQRKSEPATKSKQQATSSSSSSSFSSSKNRFIGQDLVESIALGTTGGAAGKDATTVTAEKPTKVAAAAAAAATATTTCIATTMTPPTNRQALGLDTRVMDTLAGQKVGTQLRKHLELFVRDLDVRGTLPCLLVTTNPSTNKKTGNSTLVLQKETLTGLKKILSTAAASAEKHNHATRQHHFIHPVSFAPSAASAEEEKRGRKKNIATTTAVTPPKSLLAKRSWKLLENMIDSLCADDADKKKANKSHQQCRPQQQRRVPLNITLLTTDVSFFGDTNEASHQSACGKFWDHASKLFEASAIDSIRIVVAKTGVAGLEAVPLPKKKDDAAADDDDDHCSGKDTRSDNGDDDKADHDIMDQDEIDASLLRNHELSLAKCIHCIQAKFAEKAESQMDQMMLVGHQNDGIFTNVDISISLMDQGTPGYKHLARHWVRLAASPHLTGRLEFDLPETVDGTECKLCFDATYKIFPTALDAGDTFAQLAGDLRLLSQQPFKALQLVPQSSLDASLLFGIPITLTTGLESDFEKYQSMEALVRSLFAALHERDTALLLQSSNPTPLGDADDDEDADDDDDYGTPRLFHQRNEMFVLLPLEFPKTAKTQPHSGLLMRYANEHQLLTEATFPSPMSFLDQDTEAELSDYVQRALDGLECSPVNPLLMNHHHVSPSSSLSFTTSTTTTTTATTELEHLDALSIGGGHEEESGHGDSMTSSEGLSNATKGGVGENLWSKHKSDSDEAVATAMGDSINAVAADDMDMTT